MDGHHVRESYNITDAYVTDCVLARRVGVGLADLRGIVENTGVNHKIVGAAFGGDPTDALPSPRYAVRVSLIEQMLRHAGFPEAARKAASYITHLQHGLDERPDASPGSYLV